MNLALLEIVKAQGQKIVVDGIASYEKKYGKFNTSAVRTSFEKVGLDILLSVLERLVNNESIAVTPLKQKLLEALFDLEFNTKLSKLLFEEIWTSLYNFIDLQPGNDPELFQILKAYRKLLTDAIGNYEFFSSSSALDILQKPEEYQYSISEFSFVPKQVDESSRRIYTMFPKELYWEEFSSIPVGSSSQNLVIYEGTLYKLNPKVTSPTLSQFVKDDWIEFRSRVFDKSKRFNKVFNNAIQNFYTGFLERGFSINEIISDSKVQEYSSQEPFDEDILISTFGGQGKTIFDSVKQLKITSDYFGGHESSVLGGIEYITKYSEYLFSMAFGRNTSSVFEVIDDKSSFGRFDLLFSARITENRIPGLNFLSNLGKLKSLAHAQVVDIIPSSNKVIYNPIYAQFKSGINDTYLFNVVPNSYNDPPKVDLLLYAIESLFRRCLNVGDNLLAISKSLDARGRLVAYEGLGSISAQINEFQRIFPPTEYITDSPYKIPPGLTGCVKYLLDSYSRLSSLFIYTRLPGQALEFILKWVDLLGNKMEAIQDQMSSLGIGTSRFIPNISTTSFEPGNYSVVQYLKSLGFRDSEVNQLVSVNSFPDLVTKFAPLSDSDDLKSFFKAYELAQLIYEFGGPDGVDAYLSFLYSQSSIDSLLNILSLLQKDKSKVTYVQISKYPKLIGLLIGLTYAIDSTQLIKFNKILGKNNLTLLESIEYLLQSNQQSIIKRPEDIELLGPVVQQLIQGNYRDVFSSLDINYEQTNSAVPIALKQWTESIGKNLGNISSVTSINLLYDKASGLTPKELISILNPVGVNTELSQMVDGFSGGSFTKLLKYANITGLALKLGYYKNSPQLSNFDSDYANNSYTLPVLLDGLGKISESLSLIKLVFESNLDYNLTDFQADTTDALFFSQNKPVEVIASIIKSNAIFDEETSDSVNIARDSQIVESPGVGNSRLPNRVPVQNSITPEQFNILSGASSISEVITNRALSGIGTNLINRFIKFSETNKLINVIDQTDETAGPRKSQTTARTYIPATSYEDPVVKVSLSRPSTTSTLPYSTPEIYNELSATKKVATQTPGTNFLRDEEANGLYILGDLVKPFDRVESCKKFGGRDCDSIYVDTQELCVNPLNKSLYPEYYSTVPGSSPSKVYIDRPLGTFADYKPSNSVIPTSSLYSLPAYYEVLGSKVASVGEYGEPILSVISSEPLIPDSGGYSTSEFGNSEFGILEFVRAKLERESEFNCAFFESPFHYQKCMNIMKCKRFVPPLSGKYFLRFCPQAFAGGRLK